MRILAYLFLLCSTTQCIAQVGTHQLITLKNGSQYKGILVRNSNDTLQLLTLEDHLLLFTTKQVTKIEPQRKRSLNYISNLENQKKWYSTTNLLVDFDEGDQLGIGAETFVGLKHNNHFQNGVGFGFKQEIGWYNYEALTAHLALQNRVNLLAYGSTPFILYEPSYLLLLNSGLRSNRYKNIGHSLELGFRFYYPNNGKSLNLSLAILRRVGEDFQQQYDPNLRTFKYISLGWNPEYKVVFKLGLQL